MVVAVWFTSQVPLVEAVRRTDLSTLNSLAAQGIDMGAANRFGESVVHLATRRGSAPVLEFLLSHGASLHICDDYGKTPLHDAFWASEPRFDLVSMILERDWRLLRAADVRGATPFRYAKKRHWGKWCDFLDRVKDLYWPLQNANGTLEYSEDRLEHGEYRDGEGRCTWARRDDEGGGH